MRRSRFPEEQIVTVLVAVLKEHEAGAALSALCRRRRISAQTCDSWKQQDEGLAGSEARGLQAHEEEHARRKRLVDEQALDR